jgi:flagellum-specific peptidoglycan hydrolase FlgJ
MTPAEFFKNYSREAQATQIKFGVPAGITLAQAALESGYGSNAIGNNFFGIKDQVNDEWNGNNINADTTEFINGKFVTVSSNFRKYDNAKQSFYDHARFLKKNSLYRNLFKINLNDYRAWANQLQADKYATGPNYANKLITLIEGYNLQSYTSAARIKKSFIIIVIVFLIGTTITLIYKTVTKA